MKKTLLLCASALCAACSSSQSVAVRHSPIITSVTETSATISLTVDRVANLELLAPGVQSRSVVNWPKEFTGYDVDLQRVEFTLHALPSDTEIKYQLRNRDQSLSEEASFKTAPSRVSKLPFRFAAFGDSGTGSKEQHEVAAWLKKQSVAFALHTGDVTYGRGTFPLLEQNVLAVYQPWFARTPFFPSPGNHDYYAQEALPYLAMFALPENAIEKAEKERYYAYSWGAVRFYALDTNAPLEADSEAMTRFVEADVSADKAQGTTRLRVAYFHHPAYSSSSHGDDERVKKRLVPLLERLGFDLVLAGHDHSYERMHPLLAGVRAERGLTYVVTGGGGARLYKRERTLDRTAVFAAAHHAMLFDVTDGCQLNARAVTPSDEVLDTFTISRCEP